MNLRRRRTLAVYLPPKNTGASILGTLPAVIPSCYLLAVDATVCLLWAGATAVISTVGLSILFVSHTRLRLVSFIIEGTRLVALCVNGVLACLSLTIMLIGVLEGTDTSPQYNAALAVSGALIGGAAITNCVSFAARDSRLSPAMYIGSILSNLVLLLLAARLLVQQPEEIASSVTLYAVVLVSANALGMRLARVRK